MIPNRIRRPAFVVTLLALVTLWSAGPASAQTTYMPGAAPPKEKAASDTTLQIRVVPLASGVFAAKVDYVWTGWVVLPEGILLIDASMSDSTAAVLADSIRARSGSLPVKYVVNTHAHRDHIGGDGYFVSRGATVIAQTSQAGKIDSLLAQATGSSGSGSNAPKPAIRVDRKKILGPTTRRVEILWLGKPAHTSGDLVVYLPKQKVMFTGDIVSNKSIPWLLDPGWSRLGWLSTLDSLNTKAFTIQKLVPGHGELGDPAASIQYTRSYLRDAYDRAAKMASWGTSVTAVRDWGYLGPYEGAEFYKEVNFANMRRLYNEARGMKTPGRANVGAMKR